jgi:hypothetical protein
MNYYTQIHGGCIFTGTPELRPSPGGGCLTMPDEKVLPWWTPQVEKGLEPVDASGLVDTH